MNIVEIETDEYNGFLSRFIAFNLAHLLIWGFFSLLLLLGSFNLFLFIGLPIILLEIFFEYIPNSRYLIKNIETNEDGSCTIRYFDFSKSKQENFLLNDANIRIKYPYWGSPGIPNGPKLYIATPNFKIRQHTLYVFIKIWHLKDVGRTFTELKKLQGIPLSNNEMKILKRINNSDDL